MKASLSLEGFLHLYCLKMSFLAVEKGGMGYLMVLQPVYELRTTWKFRYCYFSEAAPVLMFQIAGRPNIGVDP